MESSTVALLIGGTSHMGKSTLAQALADSLGWTLHSTDKFARHPGRPWNPAGGKVPDRVIEHYSNPSIEALLIDVLSHYKQNVIPQVIELLSTVNSDSEYKGLIIEGSALWPEFVAAIQTPHTCTIWLTADEALIRNRIVKDNGYETATEKGKFLIEQFIKRSNLYNKQMIQAIEVHGLTCLPVKEDTTAEYLVDRCLRILGI